MHARNTAWNDARVFSAGRTYRLVTLPLPARAAPCRRLPPAATTVPHRSLPRDCFFDEDEDEDDGSEDGAARSASPEGVSSGSGAAPNTRHKAYKVVHSLLVRGTFLQMMDLTAFPLDEHWLTVRCKPLIPRWYGDFDIFLYFLFF